MTNYANDGRASGEERRPGASRQWSAAGPATARDTGTRIREIAQATLVTAAATALAAALDAYLPVAAVALVYVCGVMLVAVATRRSTSIYAALLAFLSYNFFFTEPRGTLRIESAQDVVAVFAFLVVALLCGHLAWRLRTRVVELQSANRSARVLQELGAQLARAADAGQVFTVGCQLVAEALARPTIALARGDAGTEPRQRAAVPGDARLDESGRRAADWALQHARPAGYTTDASGDSAWWLLPLLVEESCFGAIAIRDADPGRPLSDEDRRLAEAMVQLVALAADRTRLAHTLERARVESESERLRTALLSSVSHDLRSPLAAVIGAATSLAAYGETMADGDRRELLASIRGEAERLDRYIQNLLDMTRLGSGPLRLERDWIGLDEILSAALQRLRKLFPALPVERELATDLPPLYVHAALVEQALFNVLENAAKFSPPAAAVAVRASVRDGEMTVEIGDRGPGIPEDERRRVFDLFYSAERGDRGARGTGLGLTIVRGMIGAHGGRVEALAGRGGRGTTIRITLPLTEPPAAEAAESEP